MAIKWVDLLLEILGCIKVRPKKLKNAKKPVELLRKSSRIVCFSSKFKIQLINPPRKRCKKAIVADWQAQEGEGVKAM